MANEGGDSTIFNTALTADDSTAKAPLGAIRMEYDRTYGPKMYMYVRSSGTVSAYAPVVWSGTTGYTVAMDKTASGANFGKMRAVGVAGSAGLTSTYYGWIQVKGHCAHILTGAGTTGDQCTSAYAECVLACNGVQSFRKVTTKSGSTGIVLAGIVAWAKVGEASSTSGYIHCR